jgi:hypothetical protein
VVATHIPGCVPPWRPIPIRFLRLAPLVSQRPERWGVFQRAASTLTEIGNRDRSTSVCYGCASDLGSALLGFILIDDGRQHVNAANPKADKPPFGRLTAGPIAVATE